MRLLPLTINFLWITIFIFITAIAGYYLKALSRSGAIMATIVGLAVAIGFGLSGLLILGAFFASSSIFSTYKAIEKQSAAELHEKSDERDDQQVLANGAVAGIAGIFFFVWESPLMLVVFLTSIASSTADTWASEIGVLSKKQPISIKSFRRVLPGTSGAVSVLGTFMAFFGSLFIGMLGLLLFQLNGIMFSIVVLFGFLGNMVDTLLGAFSQVTYRCACCELETEREIHCGQQTKRIKGYQYMNNEAVNFISSFLAAAIGAILYFILQ